MTDQIAGASNIEHLHSSPIMKPIPIRHFKPHCIASILLIEDMLVLTRHIHSPPPPKNFHGLLIYSLPGSCVQVLKMTASFNSADSKGLLHVVQKILNCIEV